MSLKDSTLVKKVEIYDTTLRDGAQLEGISLTVDDKLRIAKQLDRLGVHYIEGGWPGANPKDEELFLRATRVRDPKVMLLQYTPASTMARRKGLEKILADFRSRAPHKSIYTQLCPGVNDYVQFIKVSYPHTCPG